MSVKGAGCLFEPGIRPTWV